MIGGVDSVVLIGMCGAGKSTIMQFCQDLDMVPISSSHYLRAEMKGGGERASLIRDRAINGDTIEDSVIFELMDQSIANVRDRRFVMDGFPVNVKQLDWLENILSIKRITETVKFIFLDVSSQTVVDRLSGRLTCENCFFTYHKNLNPPKSEKICDRCGGKLFVRPQDREEVIQKRIRYFKEETLPLIQAIRDRDYNLLTINTDRQWRKEELFI